MISARFGHGCEKKQLVSNGIHGNGMTPGPI